MAAREAKGHAVDQSLAVFEREVATRHHSSSLAATGREATQAWVALGADVDGHRLTAGAVQAACAGEPSKRT